MLCWSEWETKKKSKLLKPKKREDGEVSVLSEQNLNTFSDNGKFYQV